MEPRKIIDYGTYCVSIEDEEMPGHLKLRLGVDSSTRSSTAVLIL